MDFYSPFAQQQKWEQIQNMQVDRQNTLLQQQALRQEMEQQAQFQNALTQRYNAAQQAQYEAEYQPKYDAFKAQEQLTPGPKAANLPPTYTPPKAMNYADIRAQEYMQKLEQNEVANLINMYNPILKRIENGQYVAPDIRDAVAKSFQKHDSLKSYGKLIANSNFTPEGEDSGIKILNSFTAEDRVNLAKKFRPEDRHTILNVPSGEVSYKVVRLADGSTQFAVTGMKKWEGGKDEQPLTGEFGGRVDSRAYKLMDADPQKYPDIRKARAQAYDEVHAEDVAEKRKTAELAEARLATDRANQARLVAALRQGGQGGGVGTGGATADIGDAIIRGEQPPTLTNMPRKDAQAIRGYLAKKGFDLAKADMDWKATQKRLATLNGPQQVRLAQAITFTRDSLPIIEDLAKEWRGGKFAPLNKVNLMAARNGAYGPNAASIATRLEAQISDLTSELGTVYKGGNSSTDQSLKLAAENLKSSWSEKVLMDNVGQIRKNLSIRENSMKATEVMGLGKPSAYAPSPEQAPAPKPSEKGGKIENRAARLTSLKDPTRPHTAVADMKNKEGIGAQEMFSIMRAAGYSDDAIRSVMTWAGYN